MAHSKLSRAILAHIIENHEDLYEGLTIEHAKEAAEVVEYHLTEGRLIRDVISDLAHNYGSEAEEAKEGGNSDGMDE